MELALDSLIHVSVGETSPALLTTMMFCQVCQFRDHEPVRDAFVCAAPANIQSVCGMGMAQQMSRLLIRSGLFALREFSD